MTELQQTFLFYTFIYFLIKGGLYVALYVATIVIEKDARMRYAKLRALLARKRAEEAQRWAGAYRLYYQKYHNGAIPLKQAS
ncbi:MAG TPA: hypothetical protein PLG09_08170 [Syntrophomonadaceae bacterium]|nr:hypothetical protein [Syntrophomonadaceae bacterium]HOQ10083.1 hypothetical protein [Syntrophomonadaceae bacterium]HPU49156.1 hypothetical protein [Syntrophomonadaceae bacterium]